MSGGGRQTGTVPKTKHNTRSRRENTVNHIPNNLDWHDSYHPQRARKESNTSASRHSDAGDDMYEDNPWIGLAPQTHHADDDEVRWSNVKSSNLTPERSGSLSNVDGYISGNRSSIHRQDNTTEDRESSSKGALTRGRLKMRIEQRKMEALQQHQAVLMSLRNKVIQQVKPVQTSNVEEMHQQPGTLMGLRGKVIQQVKPVQQEEMDHSGNVDDTRLPSVQEYASIIQVLERDEASSNLETADGQSEQQLRKKLNDLLAKKAQVDSILAYIDSDHAADAALSLSSDEGEGFSRSHAGGDSEEVGRRDVMKQDNREQATAAYLHMKELKLEDIKIKLEQLQLMLARVERMKESRPARMNGETSSHCSDTPVHSQVKNCPSNSVLEKLHTKKFDLDQVTRKVKSNPVANSPQGFTFNHSNIETWSTPTHGTAQANGVDYSSDDAEADYDESPVKLCSSLQSFLPQATTSKTRGNTENMVNGLPNIGKYPTGESRSESGGCTGHADGDERARPHPQMTLQDVTSMPNTTALALQISQLQIQMEQMQMLYQNMLEKQHVNVFPSPQPWLPPNNMGFMQYMSPSAQWHQHQLLINSLNQCCQLIWHQQRELAGLRQALTMLQEEGSIYKCPTSGYGNNLNFDAGLIWTQPSPQMLNNQVPPGNRANNYWDNFRSYSRQNLLSGRNKSNEGSLAESLPTTRLPPQTDNLRAKDNSCLGDGRVKPSRCRAQFHLETNGNGPNSGDQNCSKPHSRRFNNSSKNVKLDTDVHSLEQSVYSELETVITEAERSPDMLLQLLSQLKTIRSQHQQGSFQDNLTGMENDSKILESASVLFSRMDNQRNQPSSSLMLDHNAPKLETFLQEVDRVVMECDVCTPNLLQEIVSLILRTFHLSPQHEIVTRLEASLLRFQGNWIVQIVDELLRVIESVLSPYFPSSKGNPQASEDRESGMMDHNEEEGAVGGVPLTSSQRLTAQSVDTELAEADQPQHVTNDVEVYEPEDVTLPGIELGNQELIPREGGSEQPSLET